MRIPVHFPWLPGYIDVAQTVLIILTMAGLFLHRLGMYASIRHHPNQPSKHLLVRRPTRLPPNYSPLTHMPTYLSTCPLPAHSKTNHSMIYAPAHHPLIHSSIQTHNQPHIIYRPIHTADHSLITHWFVQPSSHPHSLYTHTHTHTHTVIVHFRCQAAKPWSPDMRSNISLDVPGKELFRWD